MIANRHDLFEQPQRSYLWRVLLPNLITDSTASILPFQRQIPDRDILVHRIQSISLPYPRIQTNKNTFGNSYWYSAANNDIGTISMEIEEDETGKTFAYLAAWQSLIMNDNPRGTYNPPAYYKKDIDIYRLSVAHEEIIHDVYKDCFITGIADVSSDYSTSSILKYQVTFSTDEVIRKDIYNYGDYEFKINQASQNILVNQKLKINRELSGLDSEDVSGIIQDAFGEILS